MNYKKYKIKDLCDVLIGGTPSRSNPEYWDSKKETNNFWVSIRDLTNNNGIYIGDSSEYISDLGVKKSNVKLLKKNTVVMSFKLTIGKMAITGNDLYTNEAIAGFNIKDVNLLDFNYLYYILPVLGYDVDQAVKGKTLNKEKILNTSIELPSLEEQKRVADILISTDEDIFKTDEIIDESEKLKDGLMEELFSKGIGHTKFKETKIGRIPEEWELKKMSDICTVRQGLQIPIAQRFKEPGENRCKYITIKNLKDNNFEYIESPKQSVICKEDDILMTRTGNTGTVVCGVDGVFHNNFFMVDYNKNSISKDYLIYYLNRRPIQKTILDKAGLTTIPDLNHGDFYSIFFLMPKLEEQNKIAEILINIDNKINNYKEIKNNLIKLKNGLMMEFFK